MTDDLVSFGQKWLLDDVLLLPDSRSAASGDPDAAAADDDDDGNSGCKNNNESVSSITGASASAAVHKPFDGRNAMLAAPRRHWQKRLNHTLDDWESNECVPGAQTWEWDANKEDFGEEVVEFSQLCSRRLPATPHSLSICSDGAQDARVCFTRDE
jgi:hypothetical protein